MRRAITGAVLAWALVGCAGRGSIAGPAPVDGPIQTLGVEELEPAVPVANSYRRAVERGTRSESGAPGPAHWTNRVSYQIQAELDTATNRILGHVRIVYRNASPDTLPSILLNLYQNVFSEGVPRNRFAPITGGMTLRSVVAGGQTLEQVPTNRIPILGEVRGAPPGYSVQGTLGRVQLPRPLLPGDSAVLEIEWEHRVPPATAFRTAWEDALGWRVYQVAQWYPQVAMYDDLDGWDDTPYLGDGEFYLPYGDFDVAITVPMGFLVGATGDLVNPGEVLTPEAQERLLAAARADTITRVVTDADITAENTTQRTISGTLTWRFVANDVRDFAFATSAGYVWDATRAVIPDGAGGDRVVTIHALYRPEAPNWGQAAEFGRHSLDLFSRMLIPYRGSQMTIAEGPIYGMEYPMVIFIGRAPVAESLYGVIAHETAHQWFPMMVGSDEASYAWLDEGLATYLENVAMAERFGIEDPFALDRASYLSVAGSDVEVPLMWHTDLVSPYGARTVAAYSKPAVLLRGLEWILGPGAFREGLTTFASEWLGRNPTPWDFFATMERQSGRNLGWFFAPWWFETAVLDQAIANVEGAETGRATVTIENRGGAVAPVLLSAATTTGSNVSVAVDAEAWLGGVRTITVTVPAPDPISRITIDPQQIFPDVDRGNNEWTAPAGAG